MTVNEQLNIGCAATLARAINLELEMQSETGLAQEAAATTLAGCVVLLVNSTSQNLVATFRRVACIDNEVVAQIGGVLPPRRVWATTSQTHTEIAKSVGLTADDLRSRKSIPRLAGLALYVVGPDEFDDLWRGADEYR